MKKIVLLILISLIATGCSCTYRLQTLMIRCPELFETKKIIDTVIIPEYKKDTTFFLTGTTDTFTVFQDRIQLKIVRQFDTLKVFTKLPADTIYKTITIEKVKPVIEKKSPIGVYIVLGLFLSSLLLLLFIYLKKMTSWQN